MIGKIECKRLILKPISLKQLEWIQNGGQGILMESVLSDTVKAAVSHKVERMRKAPKEAHPWLTYWMILEKDKKQGVGVIGSKYLPDEDGFVELGYAVAEERQGRGYMTEALLGFLDWLYEWPFCSGARLSIQRENEASVRTAQKCGFQYEKTENIYRIYTYIF